MLNKIIHTVGSRALMALANLALLLITTRIMGAEVKGQISLFILNISVLAMVSGIFSGPSLVYLTPRQQGGSLLFLAYVWSVIVTLSMTAFLHMYGLSAGEPAIYFVVIGLSECLLAAHLMTLLGKENVKQHNFIQVLKPFLTVAILLSIIHFRGDRSVLAFLEAYGIATGLAFLVSLYLVLKTQSSFQLDALRKTISESWHHGLWIQIGNLAQLLNYRASYYFLELLTQSDSMALVRIGIYSAAIQIAESLWLLARSVATVQYSRVSNIKDRAEALRISIRLIKFNYSVTALGCLVLALLPEIFYSSLLGEDFGSVRNLVLLLIPGIIALSVSNGISHFFAGVGDNRFNAQASVLGLISSIGVGYFAVFYFSVWGAAVAASITYVLQTCYQIGLMVHKDGISLLGLLVDRSDILEFKAKVKDAVKSSP